MSRRPSNLNLFTHTLCVLVLLVLQVSGLARGFWCQCDGVSRISAADHCNLLTPEKDDNASSTERHEHVALREEFTYAAVVQTEAPALLQAASEWFTAYPPKRPVVALAGEGAHLPVVGEWSAVFSPRSVLGQSLTLLI